MTVFEYKMATPSSCGVDEVWTILRTAGYSFTREQVSQALGFPNTGTLADDAKDSPGAHYNALEKLQVPYRTVTLGTILEGKAPEEATAILIHMGEDPLSASLHQHWVILSSVNVAAQRISVQWGDGSRRVFDFARFTDLYKNGGPTATAYCVNTTSIGFRTPWRWVAKAWDWLMSFLFGAATGCALLCLLN